MDKPYVRRPSLLWPLILISAGVLLLLENFNVLPPGTWEALAQLWPVLLILIGLDILIGRRSALGAVFMLVVGVLVVGGALTWAALRASAAPAAQTQTLIQSTHEVKTATVVLNFKVGDLFVSALNDSAQLMEGEAHNGSGDSVQQTYAAADSTGRLTLTQHQSAVLIPFLARQGTQTTWDIRLTPDLPLALNVDAGVGTAHLDLSGLNLTELDLNTGVGQTTVAFPEQGALKASLDAGVGNVILTIPSNLPVRITVGASLTSVYIPTRFARSGDVYTTASFSTQAAYLDLKVNAGVGNVTVK